MRLEGLVCFAIGVGLGVAGSLGARALASASGPAAPTAAVEAPAPAAGAPSAAESLPAPAEPLPASRYAPVEIEVGGDPGRSLGRFELTRYYVADEARFAAASDDDAVTIYDDRECKAVASVSRAFVRELDMEGTGRLRDGRTVNVSNEHCGCGRSPCYRTTTGDARWGYGARGEPLEPFRTIAVDTDVIPLGTQLYIPELDGLTMPGPAPWGGFVHDGCVVAVDVGGRIHGRHIDFFVGRKVHGNAFDARYRLDHVTVHRAGDRCDRPHG